MSEWISVKDRLPEKDGDYVAYGIMCNEKFTVIRSFWHGEFWWDMGETAPSCNVDITHWMPLPKPPEPA